MGALDVHNTCSPCQMAMSGGGERGETSLVKVAGASPRSPDDGSFLYCRSGAKVISRNEKVALEQRSATCSSIKNTTLLKLFSSAPIPSGRLRCGLARSSCHK